MWLVVVFRSEIFKFTFENDELIGTLVYDNGLLQTIAVESKLIFFFLWIYMDDEIGAGVAMDTIETIEGSGDILLVEPEIGCVVGLLEMPFHYQFLRLSSIVVT